MQSANTITQNASPAHIAANCSVIVHSFWRMHSPTVKKIGTSYSQPSALHADFQSKLAIAG